jgi:hypothetical protein
MATKTITLRRKINSGYDVVHPETKLSLVSKSAGVAMSDISLSIKDANILLNNVTGYGYTTNTGNDANKFLTQDAEEIRELFQIAEEGHSHTNFLGSIYVETYDPATTYSFGQYVQEDGYTYKYINQTPSNNFLPSNNVNELGVGTVWNLVSESVLDLETIFNNATTGKVQLDESSEIELDQFKTFQFQGMKFEGTFGANPEAGGVTIADTAEDLFGTIVTYADREKAVGAYKIAIANGNNAEAVLLTETYNDSTYNWTIRHYDDGVDVDGTEAITLEVGDWIVYEKFESNTFYFSVINNQYKNLTASLKGIGQVTAETSLGSYQNSRGATYQQELVDETALRSALKDIREVIVFQNPNAGVIKYYADVDTDLPGVVGQNNDFAMIGTETTKAVYQRINGNWADSGYTVTFPSGVGVISAAGGNTLYDEDNDVHMIGIDYNADIVQFTTTNAEPIENDLVFYVA